MNFMFLVRLGSTQSLFHKESTSNRPRNESYEINTEAMWFYSSF